jgi:hypothetical protein
MTSDPDRPAEPPPWSTPSTATELPTQGLPRIERREPFLGKPRWVAVLIGVGVVLGAVATALAAISGGGLPVVPPPTFAPSGSAAVAGPTSAAAAGVYQAPADLCQDADFTNLRPPFTTIGDQKPSGSTAPGLVVAGCDGTTGNDTVNGAFSFEVQVSSHPDALLDLFHQQRAAVAAQAPVTPVAGLGTEAYQYVAVGQHGLSLEIYDSNLIMRLSWTAQHTTDKVPADLPQALTDTCRSTMRLLRQV